MGSLGSYIIFGGFMVYFLKKSTPSKKGLYLQIYINYYDSSTKKKKTISYKALGYVSDLQA